METADNRRRATENLTALRPLIAFAPLSDQVTTSSAPGQQKASAGTESFRGQKTSGSGKLLFLESIRGLAALIVLLHHFILSFVMPQNVEADTLYPDWGPLLLESPLRFFHRGPFAVRIFFVLSGFVLSLSFFQSGEKRVLTSAAIRRYFRLMLPVLSALLIAWALIRLGLFQSEKLVGVSPCGSYLASHFDGPGYADPYKSFFSVLKLGLLTIFFYPDGVLSPSLNPFLWTMQIELMGSYFVFALLALCGPANRRWAIYAGVGIALLKIQSMFLVDFLVGLALCDLYVARQRQNRPFHQPAVIAIPLCLMGLLIGAVSADWIKARLGFVPPAFPLLQTVGATLVVGSSLMSPMMQRFLESKPLAFIGKVSFPLYLIHFVVLSTVTSWVFVGLQKSHYGLSATWLVSGLIYFTITILSAWGLYHAADHPSILLGKRVERWFINKGQ